MSNAIMLVKGGPLGHCDTIQAKLMGLLMSLRMLIKVFFFVFITVLLKAIVALYL